MVVCRVIRDASFEKTARSRRCPALSVNPKPSPKLHPKSNPKSNSHPNLD